MDQSTVVTSATMTPLMTSLFRSSAIVMIVANLANFLNYLHQIILGRSLSHGDFGIYNGVNSFGLVAASAVSIIPFVLSKHLVERPEPADRRALFVATQRFSLLASIATALFFAAISPWVARYLAIPSPTPVILFGIWLATIVQFQVNMGFFLGFMKYVDSSMRTTANAGLRLLAVGILVVAIGGSYNEAFIAGILANILTNLWMSSEIKKWIPEVSPPPGVPAAPFSIRRMLPDAIPMTLHWIAIAILTNIDMVVAKHNCDPAEAGVYAGAALIARIATFLPGALIAVLFPEVTARAKDPSARKSILWLTLALTAGSSGLFGIAVHLFPNPIVGLFFGEPPTQAELYAPTITWAMAILSTTTVLTNYLLARSQRLFLVPLWAVVIGLMATCHWIPIESPSQVAEIVFWGNLAALATMCVAVMLPSRRQDEATLGGTG